MTHLLISSTTGVQCVVMPSAGLTPDDIRVLSAALGEVRGWSLEFHLDECATRSLILIPDGDDAVAPTLLITREKNGLTLSSCRFDVLVDVATAPSSDELIPALCQAVRRKRGGRLDRDTVAVPLSGSPAGWVHLVPSLWPHAGRA